MPRVLFNEPTYQRSPGYLLFSFDDQLTLQHWLVVDGTTIYFDRNGNGDITEAEDRVVVDKDKSGDESLFFPLGDITVAGRKHVNLSLKLSRLGKFVDRDDAPDARKLDTKATVVELWGEFEIPGYRGRCAYGRVPRYVGPYDNEGFLELQPSPKTAKVVHFSNHWCVQLQHQQKLFQGIEQDVIVNVGSRGLGAGTFSKLGYEKMIPEDLQPRLKFSFARNGSGMQEYEAVLKERC